MRRFSLPMMLALTVTLTACHREQVKKGDAAVKQPTAQTAQAKQPAGSDSPDQKKKDAQLRATKQVLINQLNDVLGELSTQGITVRKTPLKKPWRLIVPALQKVSDPLAKHKQATELADGFRKKVEPIMARAIDVAVYDSDKETTPLN